MFPSPLESHRVISCHLLVLQMAAKTCCWGSSSLDKHMLQPLSWVTAGSSCRPRSLHLSQSSRAFISPKRQETT